MKARYSSTCRLCGEEIQVGDEFARLVGTAVHVGCKAQHLAAQRMAAEVEELPEARGWADAPQWTRPRRKVGVPFVPEKKYLDGRNPDGTWSEGSDKL